MVKRVSKIFHWKESFSALHVEMVPDSQDTPAAKLVKVVRELRKHSLPPWNAANGQSGWKNDAKIWNPHHSFDLRVEITVGAQFFNRVNLDQEVMLKMWKEHYVLIFVGLPERLVWKQAISQILRSIVLTQNHLTHQWKNPAALGQRPAL